MTNVRTTIANSWRNPELRSRMIFTLMMIVAYRIGAAVPVPFIDRVAFTNLLNRFGSLGSMMDIISGGALSSVSIFAMGIQPYINASIIIQLLTVAIPALENLSKEGETGRKKIQQIVRIVTVCLGLLQAFFFWMATKSSTVQGISPVLSALVIIASFTAGTAVVMWIGEAINFNGVGNGISILIFVGIISRLPGISLNASRYFEIWRTRSNFFMAVIYAIILVLVALAILIFVIFVHQAERRIPVQYAKRVKGRRQYGGQSSYIPIRVNQSSVMPVIFAMAIIQMPSLIVTFFFINSENPVVMWFRNLHQNPFYYLIQIVLIIAFTFFYSEIQYNPYEISANIQKNGGYIPGIRPGRPTADFIARSSHRLCWVDGIFLSCVTVLPGLIGALTRTHGLWFGGTAVIIIVGVCMDLLNQLEAQMMQRQYKGFLG
ncbi:MAG: preprotein translocase subunit SecY [Eubacteriales bacterium]|nr:preprotein translocase subunit SecY [Eubacteriales bacterium]